MKHKTKLLRIAVIDNDQLSTDILVELGGTQDYTAENEDGLHIFLTENFIPQQIALKDGDEGAPILLPEATHIKKWLVDNGYNAFSIAMPEYPRMKRPANINEIMQEPGMISNPKKK